MQKFTKTQKSGSIIVLEGNFTQEEVAAFTARAKQALKKQVQIDGFRDGNIPDAMLEAKVGANTIRDTAAELLLNEKLPTLLMEHNVMPLVAPHASVHTHDDGVAHVTIEATVYPVVTLPDYKKIATDINKNKKEISVTDEDVTNALIHFRRERVRVESLERGESPETALKNSEDTAVESLPPLDDEFITQIGMRSVAEFEENIKKNLHTSKSDQTRSEHRAAILKVITEGTTADTPEPLVEYEIAKMESGLAQYLAEAGMNLDGYLSQIKKSREDLHKEWHEEAAGRAKTQLALIEISKRESITEDRKELDALVESVMNRMKDADRNSVEAHYATLLRNEKVLTYLESLT
jgi:FKBP-type peptidyl-prolyl cis-trans isomerase (trigger factor)